MQVFLHARIPGIGQFTDLQRPFHQGDFQLEPQHDVQVISSFIRFNANERGFNLVDGFIKGILGHIAQLGREKRLGLGIEKGPESVAATDQVFPHA